MATPDKLSEFCLAFVGTCLPSSDWAAWVQAIFSAAAVLAAVSLVWWQMRASKRQGYEAALLVASGLLTLVDQAAGGMQSVAQGLRERISGQQDTHENAPLFLASVIATLPLPSKEDLLLLNAGLPICAMKLLRASNSTRQVQSALEFMGKVGIPAGTSIVELWQPLQALASDVAKAFEEAKRDLDKFCPP